MYQIKQHVHYNLGKEPKTYTYDLKPTLDEATEYVRMLNRRNEGTSIDDPERIAVTYSIGPQVFPL